MSVKRKSAFSVYKMQKKMAENDENLHLNSASEEMLSVERETQLQENSDIEMAGGKKAKLVNDSIENDNSRKISKNKHLSKASKLRQSIGSIRLNRKSKSKRTKLKNDNESGSDSDEKRAGTSNGSKAILKADTLGATRFAHQINSNSSVVGELPKQTIEWLISPVTTEKFFR